jgi:hypothetical protein
MSIAAAVDISLALSALIFLVRLRLMTPEQRANFNKKNTQQEMWLWIGFGAMLFMFFGSGW